MHYLDPPSTDNEQNRSKSHHVYYLDKGGADVPKDKGQLSHILTTIS